MTAPTNWRHWSILALLVLATAAIGARNLGRHSLWLDEYWALYLATGRGDAEFNTPAGKVLDPPPQVGFENTPSWPHIWTTLNFATHPPLHFLILRGWIALFGDSDRAIRSTSLVCWLAGAVLLFDTLRRRRGAWEALISAGLMLACVPAIDLASEARPYTIAVFIGLICCRLILDIEERGAALWRIIALAMSLLLLCLTHYLAIAPAGAIAIFAAARLRGSDRKRTLIGIAAAAVVFAVAWGPMMPAQRGTFALLGQVMSRPPYVTLATVGSNLLSAPQILQLGKYPVPVAATFLFAGLFFIAPLANRFRGDDLLWWLWAMSALGLAAGDDLLHLNHRVAVMGITKYVFLASPAVFALIKPVKTPWLCRAIAPLAVLALFADPGMGFGNSQVGERVWLTVQQIGILGIIALCAATTVVSLPKAAWFGVAAVACLAIFATVDRMGGDDLQAENWQPNRKLAAAIETSLQPGDLLIFDHSGSYGNFWSYFVFQHYTHDRSHAVMLADSQSVPHPQNDSADQFKSAVLVTGNPDGALRDFPGWHVVSASPRIGADVVERLQR